MKMRHWFCTVFLMLPGISAAASDDVRSLGAGDAAEAIRSGALTSEALVETLITHTGDDAGNHYITFDANGARAAARTADAAAGARGPLHGVPIVLKDNIAAAGLPTTAGTPGLRDWVPDQDAPVVARLRAAGAIILGKTNLHELAFGITSNNAAFGAVANAYDPDRFAGGSSGGTGAVIGARLAPAGLGTDTGGSVRIPAALNGAAGLRPSVGRYPQAGLVPISHTRDTAGPIARNVADLILLDGVITEGPLQLTPLDLGSVRLGVPSAFNDRVDPETGRLMSDALAALEAAGATLVPLDLSDIAALNEKVGFPIALYEARVGLARFLADNNTGVTLPDLAAQIVSPDVKFVFDNLILGDQAIPEDVYQAVMTGLRPQLQTAYAEVFAAERLDALVFPTTPLPAQSISGSDQTVQLLGEDVPTFQTFIRNTDPGSNAGLPGLSLPIGLTAGGLPVGLELDGPAFSDRHLLALGLAVETVLPDTPAPGDE